MWGVPSALQPSLHRFPCAPSFYQSKLFHNLFTNCYYAVVKLSRVVLLIILVLVVGGLAYTYFPPFRLFAWVAVGRSPVCTLEAALKSPGS